MTSPQDPYGFDDEDFIAPQVSVKRVRGKGRGVVADAAIPIGTTIARVKPFCIIGPNFEPSIPTYPYDDVTFPEHADPLCLELAYRFSSCSNVHQCLSISSLCTGDVEGVESFVYASDENVDPSNSLYLNNGDEASMPLVDIDEFAAWKKRVLRDQFASFCAIKQHNAFSDCELERVELLAMEAQRYHHETPHCDDVLDVVKDSGPQPICGIYLFASMLNHSCSPNATWTIDRITGQMIVCALRDIGAHEELQIAYVDPLCSSMQRRNVLEMGWGFRCGCERCNYAFHRQYHDDDDDDDHVEAQFEEAILDDIYSLLRNIDEVDCTSSSKALGFVLERLRSLADASLRRIDRQQSSLMYDVYNAMSLVAWKMEDYHASMEYARAEASIAQRYHGDAGIKTILPRMHMSRCARLVHSKKDDAARTLSGEDMVEWCAAQGVRVVKDVLYPGSEDASLGDGVGPPLVLDGVPDL